MPTLALKVPSILAAWVGCGVEAVTIFEAGIVNFRATIEPYVPLPSAREADIQSRQRHVREVRHYDDIVARTAVLPTVVGEGLVAIIQVEDVEVLASQPAGVTRQVAPEGDQIAIHLHDPFKLWIRGSLEIYLGRRFEAEVARVQHLLTLENHRNPG